MHAVCSITLVDYVSSVSKILKHGKGHVGKVTWATNQEVKTEFGDFSSSDLIIIARPEIGTVSSRARYLLYRTIV